MQIFRDRAEAGQLLAESLEAYAGRPDVIVLAIPRGGVPVGYEVAKRLHVPLDLLLVRKLGVPFHPELAMGAISSGGALVVDSELMDSLGLSTRDLAAAVEREHAELERREREFRGSTPPLDITGKTVIVVDDGLATGSTMQAGIETLRARDPASIVIGVPVAPRETCDLLRDRVDQLICLVSPPRFYAVGVWYFDFSQTTDGEVRAILERARRDHQTEAADAAADARS